jgi:hypothetical protein
MAAMSPGDSGKGSLWMSISAATMRQAEGSIGSPPLILFWRYRLHHSGGEAFAERHAGSQAPNHGGHTGLEH